MLNHLRRSIKKEYLQKTEERFRAVVIELLSEQIVGEVAHAKAVESTSENLYSQPEEFIELTSEEAAEFTKEESTEPHH